MNGIHEVGGSIPPGSTIRLLTFPLLTLLLLAIGASAAQAQPVEPCGAKAGLYASGTALRLWVRRAGEMTRDNPLRPLSPDTEVVLDVVVNGRAATAFGPDVQNLRQGVAIDRLQGEAAAAIRWRATGEALPPALRIVAEDGRVLFQDVRFVECSEPPKVAATPKAARPAPANPSSARDGGRPPVRLPQGAIP